MNMVGKIVISLMSVLLVAVAFFGLYVALKHNGPSQDHEISQSSRKMVASICESTKYKKACIVSLEPASKNSSATIEDYIMAVIGTTLTEVTKTISFVGRIHVKNETAPQNLMALKDCKFFLQYAEHTLQDSVSLLHRTTMLNIEENGRELLSWMSAVYALEEYCRDEIEDNDFKSVVDNGTLTAFQITHNAVNILAKMSPLLKLFNMQLQGNDTTGSGSHHRLMSSSVDQGGSPEWFKDSDRMLLEKQEVEPHAVVSKDGSSPFKTIGEAVAAYPNDHQGRFVIYVKAGVYEEQVIIDQKKPNIFMYGDGMDKTIITGDKNRGLMGLQTPETATFANEAAGFLARGMTFRNEAGPSGLQALAFRSMGDKSALFNCSFEGYQDTLFYQTSKQFYRNCRIHGTVDFIFGKGDALIQDSDIIVRKPNISQYNAVTADGRGHDASSSGLVIQNCRIIPDESLFPLRFQIQTFLGRPWYGNARTVVMQSELQDVIHAEGWSVWSQKENHKTCEVYEYENRGPGARTGARNKLFQRFKVLDEAEARQYTAGTFLDGWNWLPQTGFPYNLGL